MEVGTTAKRSGRNVNSDNFDDTVTERRLAILLEKNAEVARQKKLYRNQHQRLAASLMLQPMTSRRAFAHFGLMIGSLPPFALVFKIIAETPVSATVPGVFLVLLSAAAAGTGIAGYMFGIYIPVAINHFSPFRLPNRIALLTLTGFAWGAVSGALGGLFLFLFGAIFSGIAGGLIGAATLPVFAGLHAMLRQGDLIEVKHFLPIALGITLSLCAFVLGS